jgi:hypothetical protein
MIFYTGKKTYNYSTNIFDLFGENKKLARRIFEKQFALINLSKLPDAELESLLWYGVSARIIKSLLIPICKINH